MVLRSWFGGGCSCFLLLLSALAGWCLLLLCWDCCCWFLLLWFMFGGCWCCCSFSVLSLSHGRQCRSIGFRGSVLLFSQLLVDIFWHLSLCFGGLFVALHVLKKRGWTWRDAPFLGPLALEGLVQGGALQPAPYHPILSPLLFAVLVLGMCGLLFFALDEAVGQSGLPDLSGTCCGMRAAMRCNGNMHDAKSHDAHMIFLHFAKQLCFLFSPI